MVESGAELGGAPAQFHRQIPADPGGLVALRRALSAWLAGAGMTIEQQEDALIASYEAMANCAEHAYRDQDPGTLEVRATADEREVSVTVTDWGSWKTPDPTERYRGRGLLLINTLADRTEHVRRADGTTVTMSWKTG